MNLITKKWSLCLLLIWLASFVSSCGDDEEKIDDVIQNYFISVDITDRGEMSASRANTVEINLNAILAESSDALYGIEETRAVYAYEELIEELRYEISDGDFVRRGDGTIIIQFQLNRNDGKVIRTTRMRANAEGCSIID